MATVVGATRWIGDIILRLVLMVFMKEVMLIGVILDRPRGNKIKCRGQSTTSVLR